MITYEEAINAVSERTQQNRQDMRQKNLQRRTGFMDMFGVEIPKIMRNGKVVFYSPSISNDKEYLERLQFKIVIEGAGNFSPSDFSIKIGDTDQFYYEDETEIEDVDLTDYFWAQQGVLPDGDGIFPTDIISDKSDMADFYDILEAVGDFLSTAPTGDSDSDKEQKGRIEAQADMITSAGLKRITIEAPVNECDISLIMYTKYSHVNR